MGSSVDGCLDTCMNRSSGFTSWGEWGPVCSYSGYFDLDSLGICIDRNSVGTTHYSRKKNHKVGVSAATAEEEESPSSPAEEEPVCSSVVKQVQENHSVPTPSSGIMFIFHHSYPNISLEYHYQEDGVCCSMDAGSNDTTSLSSPMSADEINVLSELAEDQHDEYNVYPREGCASVNNILGFLLDDCLTAPAA